LARDNAPVHALPQRPDLAGVATLFARFESEELRRLDIFLETVAKIGRSPLVRIGDQLGTPPTVHILRHAQPGQRGEGVIRTRVANPDIREAASPALRKLRTEANPCSTWAARNILHLRAREAEREAPGDLNVRDMVLWLKAVKQALKGLESGTALVTGTVRRDDGTTREYRSRGQVLDLAQNAEILHDDLAKRDDFDLVRPLLEPAVDHAMLAHARLAFELADVADAVVAEPLLLLR